jgi:hypothetical protein
VIGRATTRVFSGKLYSMVKARSTTTPLQEAEALIVGLNLLLTSQTRVSVFAIARTETVQKIQTSKLQAEMLEAIDLLEKRFTRKQ